jgi:hypothetical protein
MNRNELPVDLEAFVERKLAGGNTPLKRNWWPMRSAYSGNAIATARGTLKMARRTFPWGRSFKKPQRYSRGEARPPSSRRG